MKTSPHNRRKFLTAIAILSAGPVLMSAINYSPVADTTADLQNNWRSFWKRSGGRPIKNLDLNIDSGNIATKGHQYRYGEIVYFPLENIVAQPTWIFWENNRSKPADVLVTCFENNHALKKIIRFNQYEMDALYRQAQQPGSEQLFLTSINNSKPVPNVTTGNTKLKIRIKKHSQIQQFSYHKGAELVFETL